MVKIMTEITKDELNQKIAEAEALVEFIDLTDIAKDGIKLKSAMIEFDGERVEEVSRKYAIEPSFLVKAVYELICLERCKSFEFDDEEVRKYPDCFIIDITYDITLKEVLAYIRERWKVTNVDSSNAEAYFVKTSDSVRLIYENEIFEIPKEIMDFFTKAYYRSLGE